MKLRASSVAFAAMVAVASTYACYGATEVTLDITTDVPCPPANAPRDQQLDVGVFVNSTLRADTQQCESRAGGNEIGTIVVAPNGARDQQVLAQVVIGTGGTPADRCLATAPDGRILTLDPTCILARRAIGLVPHESLSVPIRLYASCRGTLCPDDQTCSAGACVPAACKGAACSDPGPPFPTAPPADASPGDAAPDALPDAIPAVDASTPSCTTAGDVILANVPVPAVNFNVPRIALGKKRIYWIEPGPAGPALRAVGLDGTIAKIDGVPNPASTGPLLANDDAVWYTTGSGVVEYTIGGAAQVVSTTTAKQLAWSAHDGARGTLYYLDLGGVLMAHPVGSVGSTNLVGFPTGLELVTANGSNVYAYGPSSNSLYRWPYASSPTTIPLGGSVAALAAGNGTVFLAQSAASSIGQIVDGQTTGKPVGTAFQARTITVDGATLYLGESRTSGGTELRIGKIDASASPTASTAVENDPLGNVSNVVVSGSCAYVWATRAANPTGAILAYSTK